MNKILIKNEDDYKSWYLTSSECCCMNGPDFPSSYPCIIVEKFVYIYDMRKDTLYYTFVYINDLINK